MCRTALPKIQNSHTKVINLTLKLFPSTAHTHTLTQKSSKFSITIKVLCLHISVKVMSNESLMLTCEEYDERIYFDSVYITF